MFLLVHLDGLTGTGRLILCDLFEESDFGDGLDAAVVETTGSVSIDAPDGDAFLLDPESGVAETVLQFGRVNIVEATGAVLFAVHATVDGAT